MKRITHLTTLIFCILLTNFSCSSDDSSTDSCVNRTNPTVIEIPDDTAAGIESVINITEDHTITDVNITINITHTHMADIDIFLIAPSGTEIELSTDNGGGGDNFTNTVFDDNADDSITDISSSDAPFTGSYQPEEALSALNGENAEGNWTLKIIDDAGADIGTLDSWSIEICGD